MSEMLERVAMAIWRAEHPAAVEYGDTPSKTEMERCRTSARAVIEAIREPTPEVAEAGVVACWGGAGMEVERDMFDWGWKAAIDAILGDDT